MAAKVSIVTPCYNSQDTIKRSIHSVLNQTFEQFEYIIVDDGSTDQTTELINQFDDSRISLLTHNKNKGASSARNTGINEAEGKYIALLDSDDTWHPNKLESQLQYLENAGRDIGAVYCDFERLFKSNIKQFLSNYLSEPVGSEGGKELIGEILSSKLAVYAGSTLLVERRIVEQIGGFDTSFSRYQDVEILIRVLKKVKLGFVDEVLTYINQSGMPSAATIASSNRQLLEKYSEDVKTWEDKGYNITGFYDFELGKRYCAEGKFHKGLKYVRQSTFTRPRQVFSLCAAILAGIQSKLSPIAD